MILLTANNSFKALVAANGGDYAKTFKELEDGVQKGLIQPEAWQVSLCLTVRLLEKPKGIQRIEDLQTKYLIDQTNLEEEERKANTNRSLTIGSSTLMRTHNATTADLQAAAESYAGDPQGVPEWLRKRIRYQDPTGQAAR